MSAEVERFCVSCGGPTVHFVLDGVGQCVVCGLLVAEHVSRKRIFCQSCDQMTWQVQGAGGSSRCEVCQRVYRPRVLGPESYEVAAEALSWHLSNPWSALSELIDSIMDPRWRRPRLCVPCHKWDDGGKKDLQKGKKVRIPSRPGNGRGACNGCHGCWYTFVDPLGADEFDQPVDGDQAEQLVPVDGDQAEQLVPVDDRPELSDGRTGKRQVGNPASWRERDREEGRLESTCPVCDGPAWVEVVDTQIPGRPTERKIITRCKPRPFKKRCSPQIETIRLQRTVGVISAGDVRWSHGHLEILRTQYFNS